jgi:hypothetical protein
MELKHHTLVFTSRLARVSHLISNEYSPQDGYDAICGVKPGGGLPWMGTGAWDEEQRAVSLPLHKGCQEALDALPAVAR